MYAIQLWYDRAVDWKVAGMSLRAINLNLLPVLQALLRERNVSRAARDVGISQPAASRALSELRAILDDPLLTRVGSAFVLTPRAEALRDQIDGLCRQIEHVWQPAAFDPAAAHREFVIVSSDYAPILLVPELAPILEAQAPGISVCFADWRANDMLDPRRRIDFFLAPQAVLEKWDSRQYASADLFSDEFVPVVGISHPLANTAATASPIDDYPHVLFLGTDMDEPADGAIDLLNGHAPRRIIATVRQFGALPLIASKTDIVTIMPRRLAAVMAETLPIAILKEALPRQRLRVCLAWHRRFESDAAHRWFRELMIERFSDSTLLA